MFQAELSTTVHIVLRVPRNLQGLTRTDGIGGRRGVTTTIKKILSTFSEQTSAIFSVALHLRQIHPRSNVDHLLFAPMRRDRDGGRHEQTPRSHRHCSQHSKATNLCLARTRRMCLPKPTQKGALRQEPHATTWFANDTRTDGGFALLRSTHTAMNALRNGAWLRTKSTCGTRRAHGSPAQRSCS